MSKSDSVLANLYPELEGYRQRARARRKPSETSLEHLRGAMDDLFGDMGDELDGLQSIPQAQDDAGGEGSHDPSDRWSPKVFQAPVSPSVSQGEATHGTSGEAARETLGERERGAPGETHGVTEGETDGVTESETVSRHETVGETVAREEGVTGYVTHCETACDTVSSIHPHKLHFLAYILAARKPGRPWRFTVREAAQAMGMKYITVRNYPKFCADNGWFKYRTVKSAAWQGIEVLWMDRRVEEALRELAVSPRVSQGATGGGPMYETASQCAASQGREAGAGTVSHGEALAPLLDRQKEPLSLSQGRAEGATTVASAGAFPNTSPAASARTAARTAAEAREASQGSGVAARLLALGDEDIEFFYPHLAQIGFGARQVRQIVDKLSLVGKSADKLFEAMEHADFELSQGPIKAAGGAVVENPLGYVFRALATSGYYRRPANYVSAEEQAELDATATAKRLLAARQEREEAEFQAWRQGLSQEALEEALQGRRGPEEVWLKTVWRKRKSAA